MPITVPSTACTVLSHNDRLIKSNRSNQTRSSAITETADVVACKPYIAERVSLRNIFAADNMGLASANLTRLAQKLLYCVRKHVMMATGPFKVIDSVTDQKRICNLLLANNISLCPILHHF